MQVAKNTVVSIRYIMRNSKAEVLENNMNGAAITYLHGSEKIVIQLQNQLEGLQKGDCKIVYLTASTSSLTENFSCEVVVDDVREALKEEVLLGYPVQQNIIHCPDDCNCYAEQQTNPIH